MGDWGIILDERRGQKGLLFDKIPRLTDNLWNFFDLFQNKDILVFCRTSSTRKVAPDCGFALGFWIAHSETQRLKKETICASSIFSLVFVMSENRTSGAWKFPLQLILKFHCDPEVRISSRVRTSKLIVTQFICYTSRLHIDNIDDSLMLSSTTSMMD